MANSTTFVIIGGGLAGAKAAEALRDKDFNGRIILVAEENQLPYERPPLSKDFLAGKKSLSDCIVHDAGTAIRTSTSDSAPRRSRWIPPHTPWGYPATSPSDTTNCCWQLVRRRGGCPCRDPMPPAFITCAHSMTLRLSIPPWSKTIRSRSWVPAGSAWRWPPVPASAASMSPWSKPRNSHYARAR